MTDASKTSPCRGGAYAHVPIGRGIMRKKNFPGLKISRNEKVHRRRGIGTGLHSGYRR